MNKVEVTKEDGTKIVIEIIMNFQVEEYNRNFIAFTLNDDGVSDVETVFIAEIDDNNHIKDIRAEEKEEIMFAYEQAKQFIMES